MNLKNLSGPKIAIDSGDCISIPFIFAGHTIQTGDSFLFTVRRLKENATLYNKTSVGDIYFQKKITQSQLLPLKDEDDNVVGCYMFVTSTAEEAANIPVGENVYDFTYIKGSFEYQLIPQTSFVVRGVNRE